MKTKKRTLHKKKEMKTKLKMMRKRQSISSIHPQQNLAEAERPRKVSFNFSTTISVGLQQRMIKKINLRQQSKQDRRNQRKQNQFWRFLRSQIRNSANIHMVWSTLRTRFNANVKMISQFRN